MPSLPRRKPAPAYVAVESAVMAINGRDVVIRAGETRVRGNHPALKHAPALFAVDTTGAPLVEPKILPTEKPYVDPQFRILQPIPPERRVRARQNLFAGNAWLAHAGSIWDSEHWVVKRNRANFEPAPEPDPEAA
jgi:hypothetical protein